MEVRKGEAISSFLLEGGKPGLLFLAQRRMFQCLNLIKKRRFEVVSSSRLLNEKMPHFRKLLTHASPLDAAVPTPK